MTPADLARIWRKTLRAESKGIRKRHTRIVKTEPPQLPRICMLPDCGCDGTWHA